MDVSVEKSGLIRGGRKEKTKHNILQMKIKYEKKERKIKLLTRHEGIAMTFSILPYFLFVSNNFLCLLHFTYLFLENTAANGCAYVPWKILRPTILQNIRSMIITIFIEYQFRIIKSCGNIDESKQPKI
uniref:Uncharacterized protein n=1 Tax=Onchocerca volvulus TaxID=6282 RepID=A0A8R1U3N7_ONCVO